jgi:hypothetical protein
MAGKGRQGTALQTRLGYLSRCYYDENGTGLGDQWEVKPL